MNWVPIRILPMLALLASLSITVVLHTRCFAQDQQVVGTSDATESGAVGDSGDSGGVLAPVLTAPQRAVQIVLDASHSEDPFLRANAIEAVQPARRRLIPIVQLALDDPHPAVRFAALAAIGKQTLIELSPQIERLLTDDSLSVQAAAMFALHRCSQPVDISPMATMLASNDPSLRGNVALLLGLMNDPSAVPMLRELAQTPMPRAAAVQDAIVRSQIAEALVRLGDETALSAIRAAAYSQFDEVRVLAVSVMGQLGDRRMERAFVEMLTSPPIELQLAAAATLAQFGHFDEGFELVLTACDSPIVTVRSQAVLALVHYPDPRAREKVAILLDDPQEIVRVAAAAAALRIAGGDGTDPPAIQEMLPLSELPIEKAYVEPLHTGHMVEEVGVDAESDGAHDDNAGVPFQDRQSKGTQHKSVAQDNTNHPIEDDRATLDDGDLDDKVATGDDAPPVDEP